VSTAQSSEFNRFLMSVCRCRSVFTVVAIMVPNAMDTEGTTIPLTTGARIAIWYALPSTATHVFRSPRMSRACRVKRATFS